MNKYWIEKTSLDIAFIIKERDVEPMHKTPQGGHAWNKWVHPKRYFLNVWYDTQLKKIRKQILSKIKYKPGTIVLVNEKDVGIFGDKKVGSKIPLTIGPHIIRDDGTWYYIAYYYGYTMSSTFGLDPSTKMRKKRKS